MESDRLADRDRRTPAARRLELLRSRRTRQTPDLSIHQPVTAAALQLQQHQRDAGPMTSLWNELIPQELAQHTRIRVDKGTLRVSVADSSSRFALDRLLRAGIKDQLVRKSPVPIRNVRLEATTSPRAPAGDPRSTTRSTRNRSS